MLERYIYVKFAAIRCRSWKPGQGLLFAVDRIWFFKSSNKKIESRGDIRMEWKCSDCGYQLSADAPPEECPSCHHKCEFVNVTCYIPECQDEGVDKRL
jgi:rubredoxin